MYYKYNVDGNLTGRELSLAQQYAAVGVLAFPLFWIAGAGSAVFWIIGMLKICYS